MPSLVLPSFAKGELSPALYGRVDTAIYQVGLRKARNCIIHDSGGISNRPGTVFIGPVKTHTYAPRLIDFQFKTTDTYVLEFGHQYMRVIRNDAHVLETGVTITAATQDSPVQITATSHGYSAGDEVYISGIVGMTELNGRRFVVSNTATNTFDLTDQATGANVDGTGYTAYSSGGEVSKIYEITTPYDSSDLATLKYTQSADVMTLTHPSYSIRELSRTDHDAWTLTEPTFAPTHSYPTGQTVAAQGSSGSETVRYRVTAIAKETFEESLPALNNTTVTVASATAADPVSVNAPSHGFATGDEVHISGLSEMTELNGRRFRITKTDADNFTLDEEDGSTYSNEITGGSVNLTFVEITNGNSTTSTSNYNQIDWTAVEGTEYYNIYKEQNGLYGFIGSTELDTFDDLSSTGGEFAPDLDISPPRLRNPFRVAGDYPGTVSYYEQRRVFGGSTNKPDTSYYSQTGNHSNFNTSSPSQADDAITATLNARRVNEIRHFVPGNDLIVFTSGAEWRINSGTEVGFAADTLTQKPQTAWGSSHHRPVVIGGTIIYVQENNSVVRNLGYSLTIDGYTGTDLTILADHLFSEYTITDFAYAVSPEPLVVAVRTDGDACTMTFNAEQEVIAWATWDTEGKFETCTALRPSSAEIDDAVYFVVKRTVGGNTVRYIERTASRRFTDVRDCVFVDSSLSLDNPLTITGITQTDPVVVTSAAHGLTEGDTVDLSDIVWDANFDSVDNETQPGQLNDGRYIVSDIATDSFSLLEIDGSKNITGATAANPVVITSASHGFSNGDMVGITGVNGMTEVNGLTYKVASATTNTFALTDMAGNNINGSGYTAYTYGGKIYPAVDGTAFNAYVEGGKVREAFTTVSGLHHLAGKTVSVLANGNAILGKTVSATGTVTLDTAASRIHVGLKYISDVETLDIEAPGGTIQGKYKQIAKVVVRFQKSRGLYIGPDNSSLTEMKQREFEVYGEPTALLTGDKEIQVTSDWNTHGRIFMRQRYPLPMTILAVIPEIEIE